MADVDDRVIECLRAIGKPCSPVELRARSTLSYGIDVLTATMERMRIDQRLLLVAGGRYALPQWMKRRAEESAALSDSTTPSRKVPGLIIDLLGKGALSVAAIGGALGMHEAAVRYHLTRLRKAGKVYTKRPLWILYGMAIETTVATEQPARPFPQLPSSRSPQDQRAESVLAKITPATRLAIAAFTDLELKLQAVAAILTGIHADIKRLGEYARHG